MALLGIDEALTYLRTGNDIDKSQVAKDLLQFGHTDYLFTRDNTKLVENSFVYVQSFKNMHACTDEELEFLNQGEIFIDDRFGGSNEAEPDYGSIPDSPNGNDDDDAHIRKDFREVFIFDSLKVGADGKSAFPSKLPDTITTWLISGFSMNNHHGFALAEPQQLIAIQTLFIKLHLPYSIKFGEVLKVDVTVFNYIKSRNPIKVDVTMIATDDVEQQFELMEVTGCKTQSISEDEQTKSVSVEQNSAKSTFFYIRALKSGQIKILVKARSPKGRDAVEKVLLVEHEGTPYYETQSVEMDLKDNDRISRQVEFKEVPEMIPDSIQFAASVSGTVIPIPPQQRSVAGRDFIKHMM